MATGTANPFGLSCASGPFIRPSPWRLGAQHGQPQCHGTGILVYFHSPGLGLNTTTAPNRCQESLHQLGCHGEGLMAGGPEASPAHGVQRPAAQHVLQEHPVQLHGLADGPPDGAQ